MGMFMATEEIQELTGFKKKSLQIQQLQTPGIPYQLNRFGSPVVLKTSVEVALSGSSLRKPRSKSIDLKSLGNIGTR